jgi:predicted acyl esterase
VNYSGYTPANPATAEPEPTLLAARTLGYGTVGVNMRGTGCSGGAFAFFEPLQSTDGYDVIEAVAAQDWSGNVGMFGISYPGISQLFVAATQPPNLTAITPLSVIADTYRSTLYPGGVLNNGFATDWAADRAHDSQPAPDGQAWAQDRIDGGDETCAANQALKRQAPSIDAEIDQNEPYLSGWHDTLAPRTFVDEIDVPVFLGGAWQDEQTGGHFPTMLDELAQNVPDLHVALTNGTHVESLGPDLLVSVFEFIDFYVGERVPRINPVARPAGPVLYSQIFGELYNIAPDRTWPLDYDTALAQYQAEPDIRVLWERGAKESDAVVCAADNAPGPACSPTTPLARYESTHPSWPVPSATTQELFLGPDGRLTGSAPTVPDDEARGRSQYEYDAAAVSQQTTFAGGTSDIWRTDATFDWPQVPDGQGVSFLTEPLGANVNVLGTSSVDLFLRSTAPDVDLEVTLSEVRPDGQETYVQAGWLRASHRAEGDDSTALAPFHTHEEQDWSALPADEFVPMRVELFPVAHVFRAGSRLRLSIDAPGGTRPFWKFDSLVQDDAVNEIGHSVGRPSHLTLPVVADPGAPAGLPPCNSLRGQPCRAFTGLRAPTDVIAELDLAAPAPEATSGPTGTIHVEWTAPATDESVTGYEVSVIPTGESFAVPAGTTAYDYDLGNGPPPADDLAFVVRATYGDEDGPPSSPSLQIPAPHPFPDVPDGAWYGDALDWVAAYEIATGFSDGTFRPQDALTRQQMVRWLWLMMGRPAASGDHPFRDVADGSWADAALDWAYEEDIVTGFPDGTFAPTASINRGQLSAWLWNLAGSPATDFEATFADVAASAWYGDAVDWLVEHEIVTGFPDDTFRPKDAAKRSQLTNWLFLLAGDESWQP